jgi:hypothetical protein
MKNRVAGFKRFHVCDGNEAHFAERSVTRHVPAQKPGLASQGIRFLQIVVGSYDDVIHSVFSSKFFV